ncbi:scarecrow-like protein 30 [Mangifera indica]|uniref:scarecrow-like protein 30 n=1 Tax=Mangifera indica TaxID=29780 RepID=UPI001CF94DA7|nr:scarecrow-like protein 30 [Mangifera indica]
MDHRLKGYNGSVNQYRLNDETLLALPDQSLGNRFKVNDGLVNFEDLQFLLSHPIADNPTPPSSIVSQEVNSHDQDYDFNDVVLKYINDMLMEEDIGEKACMFQESSAALQAAERSLYELLGEKYPPSPNFDPNFYVDENHESLGVNHDLDFSCFNSSIGGTNSDSLVDHGLNCDLGEGTGSDLASQTTSQSSYRSGNSSVNVADRFVDSPVSTLNISQIFSNSESLMQLRKGFEEASKFLPNGNSLIIDPENNRFSFKELNEGPRNMVDNVGKKPENECPPDGSRGRKNPYPDDVSIESGRNNKQSAVYTESTVSQEMFDIVLLNPGQSESEIREALRNGMIKNVQQNRQSKGPNGGKGRGKKKGAKKDVIDLRNLLTLCAQAVAANDRRNADELLKKIRQHSSSEGDGMQRMAHIFADGLEARLAGAGTKVYNNLINLQAASAANVLKAYHLFLAACPFRKVSNFFSNKTIMNLAVKATTLHIIDFGIMYGFQWPSLIQRLSSRPGGPPRLRITGIDLPQPGFRPADRVEETGRRLAKYAETFNVPFEFNAIAQKWDTIQIEDLKVESGEVVVVNCLYRLKNLLDETVVVAEAPRDIVLKLIRKINPDVFIQGSVNGAYNAPFFITRFREAVFFFSTLFDMFETILPHDIPERRLVERELLGREAMNVIACEDAERIERPETYKQWQYRNMRAGFTQLPLNKEILKMAKERVKACYHKDFVIDEDSQWLLQAWKGRIVFALSSWKPSC